MNKHEAWELKQMQSLPLDIKIRMSKDRIKEWYDYWDGQVYVSFSGGKDSTVLLHLVRSLYPEVEAVFVDTGLEYPEIRDHVKTVENVTWLKPKMPFKEVIKKYGYPIISKEVASHLYEIRHTRSEKLRDKRLHGVNGNRSGMLPYKYRFMLDSEFEVSPVCCRVMKKSPVHRYERRTKKKAYVGTLASESKLRKQNWLKNGCNAFDMAHPQARPLSFWAEQDILEYIKGYNLVLPAVYGEIVPTVNKVERVDGLHTKLETTGAERTGCMFCMFGCHLNQDERFVKLKQSHPEVYRYCMKPLEEGGLGMKGIIDWMNEHGDLHIKY